jgi:hypothetical protein
MENKERAQLEVQHQKKLESLKKEVAMLTSLLKQALDINPEKQHLQLNLHICLQLPSIHRIWG